MVRDSEVFVIVSWCRASFRDEVSNQVSRGFQVFWVEVVSHGKLQNLNSSSVMSQPVVVGDNLLPRGWWWWVRKGFVWRYEVAL